MMDAVELDKVFKSGFGANVSVRTRRPNVLFQLEMPAFMGDGDAAAIFVRPLPSGRVQVSDLGHTCMRLSYTRTINSDTITALSELAARHGFSVVDERIVSEMAGSDLLAGAIGLIQIQSEAEASIASSVARGERGDSFRATIREVLRSHFQDACELDYHEPNDKDGLYKVDAYIHGPSASLGVSIASGNIDAERAVSAKLHLARTLPGKNRWIAVTKDVNALSDKTRKRLMREYLVPVPKYDEEPDELVPKLASLAE